MIQVHNLCGFMKASYVRSKATIVHLKMLFTHAQKVKNVKNQPNHLNNSMEVETFKVLDTKISFALMKHRLIVIQWRF